MDRKDHTNMITKRFDEPRGIHQDTSFYGFYARVSGESRERLKLAQEIAARRMRDTISNAVLLDELIRAYLANNPTQNTVV